MKSSLLHRALDRVQRFAARSKPLVRLAVALRNQARCVIKYHLAEGPDVSDSGEVWLRDVVATYGRCFIDVGANVGDWLAGVAVKNEPTVAIVAFEPSESARARLAARFAKDPRIEIRAAAVGDSSGQIEFVEEHDAGKGSTIVDGFARISGTRRTVAVTTVDDELARVGWRHVDCLKIDAEGYDARVLRGAASALREQRIGVVQFEYNRAWQLSAETLYGAYQTLEACGYRVFVLKRDGLHVLNYALYEEYFEYSNFVAIAPACMPRFQSYVRGTI